MEKIVKIIRVIEIREFKWGTFVIAETIGNEEVLQYTTVVDYNIKPKDLIEVIVSEVKLTTPITDERITSKNIEYIINKCTIINKGNSNVDIKFNKEVFETMSEAIWDFTVACTYNNVIQICTPKLIKDASEGGSEVFKVDYFGDTRYLAQSPQLYKQYMVNMLNKPVFEVSNVFRAESSNTSKHLHEFTSLDYEMPMSTLDVRELTEECYNILSSMLNYSNGNVESITMTLEHAFKLLGKSNITDLTSQDELDLYKITGEELLFIINYPNSERAFYTYKEESFDVIYKGVEIVSGSVRKFKYEEYIKEMALRGMNGSNFTEYLDVFKSGAIYHGGFAIGLNRFIKQKLNLDSVKQTIISK